VLLFNGIGANLELCAPFATEMAKYGVGTIIFDIPGIGESAAPLLPYRFSRLARLAVRLLDKLGITGPVDVAGVSWGGALAQQFARQYPRRTNKLLLAATSAGAFSIPGSPAVLARLINPRRYTDRSYMRRIGGSMRKSPELLELHGRHINPPSGRGYTYQLLATMGWTSIGWLHKIKAPTLVIMGTDDPIVPVINGKILASFIPNARLFTVDDGHLFLITRIAELAPIIAEFFAA
jgi:poly(3-hydroxyalkanoate) depolymerase